MSGDPRDSAGPAPPGTLRTRVLGRLVDGPMTVTELASMERKHMSHVSRALSELRAQGLIEPVRGPPRERRYRATGEGLALYRNLVSSPR